MSQPHITLTRGQWTRLHNALCAAEAKAGHLFEVLKDGGEGLAALKSVREALAPAYAQDDAAFDRQHGYFEQTRAANGFHSIWSMYDEVGVGEFNFRHPFANAHTLIYSDHWGEKPVEIEISGPFWIDLYRAADLAIAASGDNHHWFIEGFSPVKDRPGVLKLCTGS